MRLVDREILEGNLQGVITKLGERPPVLAEIMTALSGRNVDIIQELLKRKSYPLPILRTLCTGRNSTALQYLTQMEEQENRVTNLLDTMSPWGEVKSQIDSLVLPYSQPQKFILSALNNGTTQEDFEEIKRLLPSGSNLETLCSDWSKIQLTEVAAGRAIEIYRSISNDRLPDWILQEGLRAGVAPEIICSLVISTIEHLASSPRPDAQSRIIHLLAGIHGCPHDRLHGYLEFFKENLAINYRPYLCMVSTTRASIPSYITSAREQSAFSRRVDRRRSEIAEWLSENPTMISNDWFVTHFMNFTSSLLCRYQSGPEYETMFSRLQSFIRTNSLAPAIARRYAGNLPSSMTSLVGLSPLKDTFLAEEV